MSAVYDICISVIVICVYVLFMLCVPGICGMRVCVYPLYMCVEAYMWLVWCCMRACLIWGSGTDILIELKCSPGTEFPWALIFYSGVTTWITLISHDLGPRVVLAQLQQTANFYIKHEGFTFLFLFHKKHVRVKY